VNIVYWICLSCHVVLLCHGLKATRPKQFNCEWVDCVFPESVVRYFSLFVCNDLGDGRYGRSERAATVPIPSNTYRQSVRFCQLRFTYGHRHGNWAAIPWWWKVSWKQVMLPHYLLHWSVLNS